MGVPLSRTREVSVLGMHAAALHDSPGYSKQPHNGEELPAGSRADPRAPARSARDRSASLRSPQRAVILRLGEGFPRALELADAPLVHYLRALQVHAGRARPPR